MIFFCIANQLFYPKYLLRPSWRTILFRREFSLKSKHYMFIFFIFFDCIYLKLLECDWNVELKINKTTIKYRIILLKLNFELVNCRKEANLLKEKKPQTINMLVYQGIASRTKIIKKNECIILISENFCYWILDKYNFWWNYLYGGTFIFWSSMYCIVIPVKSLYAITY